MMKKLAANRGNCDRSGGALLPHRHSANVAFAPPVWFLVADVKDIKCVINFDMPNTAEVRSRRPRPLDCRVHSPVPWPRHPSGVDAVVDN